MIKEFSTTAALSLVTGILLEKDGFDKMQELAEHLVGHPIWTHEFADKGLVHRLEELAYAQQPRLRDHEEFVRPTDKADLENYLNAYIARATAWYGKTLFFTKGNSERTEHPIESAKRVMGK